MDTNKQAQQVRPGAVVELDPDETAQAFIPLQNAVAFAGEEITIKPLSVMQVIQISRAMKQVLPALDRVQELMEFHQDGVTETSNEEIGLIVELLADYGEPLTEGIAIAIGKPVAFVREANDFAGLFGLVAAVVRINADFFAQQVGPRLAGLRTAAAASGDGPMPSTALSAAATH
ncbi:MAG: hypothetical protein M3Q51_06160 [Pseudomonadota bacterium]|nr:hypothetical protein [Pseudomonadota bacterium]